MAAEGWFGLVKDAHRAAAEAKFVQMDGDAGVVLMEAGEARDSMLLLNEGEVSVHVDGFEVVRLGPGTVLGEIALFTHAVRTATVRAATPVSVQILSRSAFLALQAAGNTVAYRIEQRAIAQLAGRFRQLVSDVVGASEAAPSLLKKTRSAAEHRGHPQMMTAERLRAVFAEARAFEGAKDAEIRTLIDNVVTRTFGTRDLIASQGSQTGPAYLLAAGKVECHAAVGDHHVRVATFAPGELFNLGHHITNTARSASYVARSGVSVLEIPAEFIKPLLFADTPTGSVLRTAIIRSLSNRVNQANAAFSLAKNTAPKAWELAETVPGTEHSHALPEGLPAPPEALPEVAQASPSQAPPGTDDSWFNTTTPDWDTWFESQ